MSRMSDLAAVLESLAAAANDLKDSADSLVRTTGQLRALFTEEEPEPREPPQPRPKRTGRRTAPEEAKEPEPPAPEPEKPAREYTKEEARALLAGLAADGHREEAKTLVEKYSGGKSFSDIDPARYPELAEEVRKIHG